MGCGASAQPAAYEPPQPENHLPPPDSAPEPAVEEVGGVAVTIAGGSPPAGGCDARPGKGCYLPFVRFDKTSARRELWSGDWVYINFVYTGTTLIPGAEGSVIASEVEALQEAISFRVERCSGDGPLIDGDEVRLRHVESDLFLEAATDTEPLIMAPEDSPGAKGQIFVLFKQGRPTAVKHRDIIYLQSTLCNYVEWQRTDDTVRAKRWRRGDTSTMTILRKEVVEQTTTELARKMQFQAFDLDGNGAISRGEMQYMLRQLEGKEASTLERLDEVMAQCDPANTGNIPYDSFATWADSGGMSEEMLQHAEVLGNVAQRCNDCLREEGAIIEVLTTASPNTCQKMIEKAMENLGSDIQQSLNTKASEQDGWIFSNYWKVAMQALMESEVDLWTRSLYDAMNGLGTDEASLTALVCTFPERLRYDIFTKYHEKYGKGLLEHIESETSFSFKKVLMFQAMAPEDCRAKILNEAMVGLGTSEDQLIRVICQCDLGERAAVKEAYQRMFARDLIEHVQSETSGDFQKALLCMLEAEESPFDLDADCEAMKAAMDGWGTDETALIKLICSKSPKQMEDVNARFKELYGTELLERVEGETSGNFRATLQGCIRHPMDQLAHSVRYCLKGWGTDDRGLITLLVHLPDFKKAALIRKYQLQFGRNLIDDIKSDTSGDYERALCSLVRPAPEIWAEALKGAMKGLGTNDELLINFLVLAKEDMEEVRKAFSASTGEQLADWIEGECNGDYKRTLVALCERDSENELSMLPLYWAQRCHDAIFDIDTLKDILISMPTVALKRGTEVFQAVYGANLKECIGKKCVEPSTFFNFSDYWKMTMTSLLDMPVKRYVKGLNDAMRCWGTDEAALTCLVCTMPENLYKDIHEMYEAEFGRTLIDHIESETSFNYKKVLVYQALSFPESRAKALNGAMVGLGTSESQLIRVIIASTMKERQKIRDAYERMYGRDLIEHIESETSGSFKNILVAVLESTSPCDCDYDADCDAIKEALEGIGTDEDALIRIVANKTPEQLQMLQEKFFEKFERSLFEWVDDETYDWGASIFIGADFRAAVLGLLRTPEVQLAYSVRDCIVGWGTDDTGLITCLVHLSERRRKQLVAAYTEVPNGGDLYAHIVGDTSGDYQRALLALVKPAPMVWAEALAGAMAGLGTADELLINWMCIAKDRMDEVRECFRQLHDGQELSEWIAGDCSGDYKDTLIRLANRECYPFLGVEVGLTIQAPPTKEECIVRFNKTFNRLCKQKRENPADNLLPPEEAQQEMGGVFLYFANLSSCAPDLDKGGLWDLTNAVGFPPADDGPDLDATFDEWDYSGTDSISWNDFVREMATRINDPGHYEADPLPEEL